MSWPESIPRRNRWTMFMLGNQKKDGKDLVSLEQRSVNLQPQRGCNQAPTWPPIGCWGEVRKERCPEVYFLLPIA